MIKEHQPVEGKTKLNQGKLFRGALTYGWWEKGTPANSPVEGGKGRLSCYFTGFYISQVVEVGIVEIHHLFTRFFLVPSFRWLGMGFRVAINQYLVGKTFQIDRLLWIMVCCMAGVKYLFLVKSLAFLFCFEGSFTDWNIYIYIYIYIHILRRWTA